VRDHVHRSNFDGYFTSVNTPWTKTLGWSEDEIKALHVNELRHPDDLLIGTKGRRRLAEGAGPVRIENRFRHRDGSYRWIYWDDDRPARPDLPDRTQCHCRQGSGSGAVEE
jgi:PAS domain S-box-containing protein